MEEDRQCGGQRDGAITGVTATEEEILARLAPVGASYDGINYSVADVPGCSAASWRSAVRALGAAFTSRPQGRQVGVRARADLPCRNALPVPSSRPSDPAAMRRGRSLG